MSTEEPPALATRWRVKRWVISGVAVALLAALVLQVWRSPGELESFRRLSVPTLLLVLLFQFLSQLLYNEALLLPLQACVKDLGYWEFFIVRTGGFLVGHVVPVAGGIAVRLAYLKRRGLTYWDFTWATLLSNVLALLAAAALSAVATGALWFVAGPPPATIVGLSAGLLIFSIAAAGFFRALPRLARHSRIQRWQWLSGMSSFTVSRPTMTSIFTLSAIRHGFNFATFGVLYEELSTPSGGWLTGGLVYALTSPLRMVQITPGNLGINEWVSALVGSVLAFDVTTGLVVALIFRAVSLAAQGLGVLWGWGWITYSNRQ